MTAPPNSTWDLVVIGGGITGAGIARDAARRGLRCLLLEKGDFASGTSSRSGKLVHGGLRYLKHLHVGMVRESCAERNLLATQVAPHLVRPIRFHLPLYSWSRTPRWLIGLGLFLYDLLSLFRAAGGTSKALGADGLASRAPGLRRDGLAGGFAYSDCTCLDFRLVIDTLLDAQDHGAVIRNYSEVTSLSFEEGSLQDGGVRVKSRCALTGLEEEHRSRAAVNAAGAWADTVLSRSECNQRFGLRNSRGIHLVFRRADLPVDAAWALENPDDGRSIYAVPWGEFVLVGTTDLPHSAPPDHPTVTGAEVDYLLKALNRYFPAVSRIHASYAGVRPLIGSNESLREEDLPRDHEMKVDPRGLLSITGGKLTTYRHMAEAAVDELIRHFFPGKELRACSTKSPLPGSPYPTLDGMSDEDLRRLVEREHVRHLHDLLCRRFPVFLFTPDRGRSGAADLASRLGRILRWSEETTRREIDLYRKLLEENS